MTEAEPFKLEPMPPGFLRAVRSELDMVCYFRPETVTHIRGQRDGLNSGNCMLHFAGGMAFQADGPASAWVMAIATARYQRPAPPPPPLDAMRANRP